MGYIYMLRTFEGKAWPALPFRSRPRLNSVRCRGHSAEGALSATFATEDQVLCFISNILPRVLSRALSSKTKWFPLSAKLSIIWVLEHEYAVSGHMGALD